MSFRLSLSSGYCDVRIRAKTSAIGGPPVTFGNDTVSTTVYFEKQRLVGEHGGVIHERYVGPPLWKHDQRCFLGEPVGQYENPVDTHIRDLEGWLMGIPAGCSRSSSTQIFSAYRCLLGDAIRVAHIYGHHLIEIALNLEVVKDVAYCQESVSLVVWINEPQGRRQRSRIR